MKTESKAVFLRRRLINFTNRALRRLGFFPFTLLYVLFNAAFSVAQLRWSRMMLCVGEVSDKATALLPPGAEGTPEFRKRSALAGHEKEKLLGESEVEFLQWCHDRGVPQIRRGRPHFAPEVRSGDGRPPAPWLAQPTAP